MGSHGGHKTPKSSSGRLKTVMIYFHLMQIVKVDGRAQPTGQANSKCSPTNYNNQYGTMPIVKVDGREQPTGQASSE